MFSHFHQHTRSSYSCSISTGMTTDPRGIVGRGKFFKVNFYELSKRKSGENFHINFRSIPNWNKKVVKTLV